MFGGVSNREDEEEEEEEQEEPKESVGPCMPGIEWQGWNGGTMSYMQQQDYWPEGA